MRVIFKAHCYTDCRLLAHMCIMRLELQLVDLLSTHFTGTFTTNTVTNRTDGALVYSSSVYRRRCEQQMSTVDSTVLT